MKRITFGVVGIAPLLMNPRVDETPPKNPKPKEEAEKRIIRDPEGRICLLDDHLYGVLVNAGRKVSLKARKMVTPSAIGQPSELYSFLAVDQRFFPLSNGSPGVEPTWEADVKYSYNKLRQQVLTIRPRFDHWSFGGSVTINDSKVRPELVRELFDVAGDCCVGSYRGRFGRFRVVKWEVADIPATEEAAATT